MRDPATVDNGHPYIINKLLGDQNVDIPHRVKNFANRQWRSRVLANNAKSFLQFRGDRVFQPKEMLWLQTLAQSSRLDWPQPVMNVVEQLDVIAILRAQSLE